VTDLRARFLSTLDAPDRARFEAIDDLEARVQRLVDDARAAHPSVALDVAALLAAIAAIATPALDAPAADLHLAIACARGDAAAIAAFDRSYGPELDVAIAKSPRLGIAKDEFRQLVRTRLFVHAPDRPARIASYAGQGSLKAWVRVTAARIVIDLSRAHTDHEELADDAMLDRAASPHDPELLILRSAYGAHVDAAFRDGLARLSVRQRNLLRQRYLHGLNADQLAPVYAVHRATAFGWLEAARQALMAHVRDALRARVPGAELDSVVGLLGSRLDVSVRGALGASIEDEG
jgi:RNA polymerase sigma-70 factor (ECF subfamily)